MEKQKTTSTEKKQTKVVKASMSQQSEVVTVQPTPLAPETQAILSSPTPSTPSSTQTTQPIEEKKPVQKQTLKKKDEAVARGLSLPISKKHAMYICSFIKNKRVESAIEDLEQVLKFKKAVPYKGEIPHRHGMMSGRYPINASNAFIAILKGLKGNISVAGLAPDKTRIYFASASWASRSQKKGGARFKRTHVVIKAREVESNKKQEKKK